MNIELQNLIFLIVDFSHGYEYSHNYILYPRPRSKEFYCYQNKVQKSEAQQVVLYNIIWKRVRLGKTTRDTKGPGRLEILHQPQVV